MGQQASECMVDITRRPQAIAAASWWCESKVRLTVGARVGDQSHTGDPSGDIQSQSSTAMLARLVSVHVK